MEMNHEGETGMDVLTCRNELLLWYGRVKRDLPWRQEPTAYKTWISEIMLQQTQVDTVISYFNRFIQEIPDVISLAMVDDDRLMKLWEGLGYYSRARNLKKCAMILVQSHGGEFPRDIVGLKRLPGIGPYTAGAIGSIAFGIKVPAIDGNVMRVSSRLFNLDDDIADVRTRGIIAGYLQPLYDAPGTYEPSILTQALMELGALVCTPKNPVCSECPCHSFCKSKGAGTIDIRPIKTPKKKQTHHIMAIAKVMNDGAMMVSRRSDGLLAGLWGLPMGEGNDKDEALHDLLRQLEDTYGCNRAIFIDGPVFRHEAKHVFTHRIWHMQVYDIELRDRLVIDYPEISWIPPEGDDIHALPTAFKKALAY